MNPRYIELAHELTVIEHLRQHLLDQFVDMPNELKCDLLSSRHRKVPKEAIIGVMERLQAERRVLEEELGQYDFVKREIRPLARVKGAEEDVRKQEEEGKPTEGAPVSGHADAAAPRNGEAHPVDGADEHPEHPDLSGDDKPDGHPARVAHPPAADERPRFGVGGDVRGVRGNSRHPDVRRPAARTVSQPTAPVAVQPRKRGS